MMQANPFRRPINPFGGTEDSFDGMRVLSPTPQTPLIENTSPQTKFREMENMKQANPVHEAGQVLSGGPSGGASMAGGMLGAIGKAFGGGEEEAPPPPLEMMPNQGIIGKQQQQQTPPIFQAGEQLGKSVLL
jgi:hypothetical protein